MNTRNYGSAAPQSARAAVSHGLIGALTLFAVMSAAWAQSGQDQARAQAAASQRTEEQRELMQMMLGRQRAQDLEASGRATTAAADPKPAMSARSHPLIQRALSTPVQAQYGAKAQGATAASVSVTTATIHPDGSVEVGCSPGESAIAHALHGAATSRGAYGR